MEKTKGRYSGRDCNERKAVGGAIGTEYKNKHEERVWLTNRNK